jgi:phosphoribosylaminoimidazole-succinocarboxamide synthase
MIYEGDAKRIYETANAEEIVIYYKDEASAFNGIKKATIPGKGIVNNQITAIIYQQLTKSNIPNHFIKKISDREQLCIKTNMIPIRVIIRNIITGSIVKRLDLKEGASINNSIFELRFKDNKLSNPLINSSHVLALGICSKEELNKIFDYANLINDKLKELFKEINITLVDLKLEFGRTVNGDIILADEISPDTCRFWDIMTKDSLDKDRFRQDLGNVVEGYEKVLTRLKVYENK